MKTERSSTFDVCYEIPMYWLYQAMRYLGPVCCLAFLAIIWPQTRGGFIVACVGFVFSLVATVYGWATYGAYKFDCLRSVIRGKTDLDISMDCLRYIADNLDMFNSGDPDDLEDIMYYLYFDIKGSSLSTGVRRAYREWQESKRG